MCILSIIFDVGSFIENIKTKKELKALKQQEKENEKIDNETIEQIDEVTSGNFDASFDAGVDVLHQLANKRK